ncbi:LacI family DNA-binding transcriptional regulator [Dactylosporangium salmoneum]|uniref:LacI family DNA-binding transcriptional regulator n=1 Tax=Dactylosporangium salmoneum TaxID=53361 RepID=UPI0031D4918B
MTQEDVARRAGVARKTVSNVISDYPHVSEGIRRRVLAAIEELGYQPNRAAQNLRSGRSGMIGLAVPELDVSYFAELTRLVVQATERRGLTVLIIQTFGELQREHESLNGFGHQRLIDGLICSPIASRAEDIHNRGGGFPVVLLGEQVSVGPQQHGIDHVGIDNVAAARDATAHLLALPRRRVAFLGASRRGDTNMADLRLMGYRTALAEAGLPVRPELVFSVDGYHRRDGAEAVRRMLTLPPEERPDGIFCANDLLAQGVIRTLHDTGYRIPHDVAVVGFDDIDEAAYSIPSLSTISPDKAQIAETAVALLLDRVGGSTEADHDTVTGYSLVVRESTRV